MKKLMLAVAAALMSLAVLFCGCVTVSGGDARDGRDGQDFSIRDCYEETNAERVKVGLEELSFLDFLKEYLNYDCDTLEKEASLQTSINRSLRCAVSVMSVFNVTETSYDWWGRPIGTQSTKQTAYGAGVIIDINKETGDAYVITNCHVIYYDKADNKIANDIYLFLYGQEMDYLSTCAISAEVISVSQSYDIALLKVENSGILKSSDAVSASFASSDVVYMGEEVYAVGNPEGYGISATKGIISKESETIQINLSSNSYYQNIKEYRVIRTDAAINGGNSGGGLFNTDGYLVGIVNAKSSSSTVDNMGFALPSSNVKRLVQLMIDSYNENGFNSKLGVTRAYLQAEYTSQPRPSKWNSAQNVYEIYESVYVTVAGDGLEAEDLITHIKLLDTSGKVVEDKEVTRLYHLDDTLLSARLGYSAVLTVSRSGEEKEVTVKLDSGKYFVAVD